MTRLRLVSLTALFIAGAIYPALAKTEKEFVRDAVMGDNSEIALGRLAAAEGSTEATRSFGQILVNDHSKHRNEAATLATQLGVLSSDDMTPEAQQEMAKLQKLSGSEFDKEFAELMVKDHEKDIAEFKKEAESGKGPVQGFASESLPTLQKHLRLAEALREAPLPADASESTRTEEPATPQGEAAPDQGQQRQNAQAAGNTHLSHDRAAKIAHALMATASPQQIDVDVAVGSNLPGDADVRALPPAVVELAPEYRGYEYVVTRDKIAIVNPSTRRVVEVIRQGT